MKKTARTPADVFDARARLQLLQLDARRQMAARLQKGLAATEEPETDSENDDEEEQAPEGAEVPDRWKLLPDGLKLHAWQEECLPRWLETGRGTVKVATGGGKTLFALAAAERLQNERQPDLRLVIVVPTIPLMVQWKSDLVRSNIPESAIAFMGGGHTPGLLANARILVCVLNSARKQLTKLVQQASWPERMLLVVDECHRAKASKAKNIFAANPRYTLGLSATPESADDDETMPAVAAYNESDMGKALGSIIYELSLEQAHAAGLLSPFEVLHVGLELLPDERQQYEAISSEISELQKELKRQYAASHSNQAFPAWCQTMASKAASPGGNAERLVGLWSRRKRLLYRARSRPGAVLGILKESLTQSDARAIVFHEAVEEVDSLFLDALDAGVPAVLEHSKLPDSLRAESIEAFRDGTAQAILSAKSLVEGFNVPSADVGIIAASTSSVRQRIQSLGRMLRRKQSDRTARIYVLYIRDTVDDSIYEQADWESLVGAERNRYFAWRPTGEPPVWGEGLEETGVPPRSYLPPSTQVDVSGLKPGDPYPGQTKGLDLRVDQAGNLRLADDTLIPDSAGICQEILAVTQYRKAIRTPAGHVIVRKDGVDRTEEGAWRFVGTVPALPEKGPERVRYKVKSQSGRRHIQAATKTKSGDQFFALGVDKAANPESGLARDTLLKWIAALEASGTPTITELYGDGAGAFWIESGGRTIKYPERLAMLEFPQ
jgi:superfamily II DNA or RNA helicase